MLTLHFHPSDGIYTGSFEITAVIADGKQVLTAPAKFYAAAYAEYHVNPLTLPLALTFTRSLEVEADITGPRGGLCTVAAVLSLSSDIDEASVKPVRYLDDRHILYKVAHTDMSGDLIHEGTFIRAKGEKRAYKYAVERMLMKEPEVYEPLQTFVSITELTQEQIEELREQYAERMGVSADELRIRLVDVS